MKKLFLLTILSMLCVAYSFGYTTVTVQDSVSTNTHWTNDKQYLLKGYVYVTSGATLTIDSGVIIKGDKPTKGALIIERGAKIMAQGTPTCPIVFTSNQTLGNRTYGDWGGVIICGKAAVNWNGGTAQVEGGPRSLYGGGSAPDNHDNSGVFSYVRVEFAGIAFSPNNEVNGVTFCGVGDATKVDHVQVSYSGDDAFEFFGGTVNTKYMVAFRTWDDDFDTDNGYNGKNQFGVVLRDPYAADQSGSKAFESDSYMNGTFNGLGGDTSQITKPIFSNFTVMGPLVSPTSTAFDPQFISGMHIRRGSAISLVNSVLGGFPVGVLVDESAAAFGSTTANIGNGVMLFKNNIIAGMPTNKDVMYVKDGARNLTVTTTNADTTTGTPFNPYAGPYSWIKGAGLSNFIYTSVQNGVRLNQPFDLSSPNFLPTTTSPIIYNTKGNGSYNGFKPSLPLNYDTTNSNANYNVPLAPPAFAGKLSDSYFDKVNFIGGFSGDVANPAQNWLAGWTNFTPNTTDYNTNVATCSITTGININVTQANEIFASVAPNPAADYAYLNINAPETAPVNIVITDISGKVVKTIAKNETIYNGIRRFVIHTDDMNSGIYFAVISSANGQKAVKFSIAK